MQFLRGISRQVGRRPQERYRKGLHSLSGYSLSSYHASCKDFRRQTTPLAYLGPESTHVNSISVIFRSCPGLHFRQPWRGIAVQARQLASHGTAEAPLSEGVAAALPDVNGMIDYPPMEKKPYEKILVANRGEIACRIFRTAERMGMRTVAVYSEADADSSHVQLAHEAVCIGPAASAKSYLNMDAIFDAIASTGAQAVHPGYGFLSENAAFVTRLETAGVAFVGPSASAMAAMGDKIESKKLAKAAGVNTVPGCEEVIVDDDHAAQIGAPALPLSLPPSISFPPSLTPSLLRFLSTLLLSFPPSPPLARSLAPFFFPSLAVPPTLPPAPPPTCAMGMPVCHTL